MKKKVITTRRLPNNPNLKKSQIKGSRAETEKKIQMLTEKLANHFNSKLSFLMAEKNYKFSFLISDIAAFVRSLENFNYQIETVIP